MNLQEIFCQKDYVSMASIDIEITTFLQKIGSPGDEAVDYKMDLSIAFSNLRLHFSALVDFFKYSSGVKAIMGTLFSLMQISEPLMKNTSWLLQGSQHFKKTKFCDFSLMKYQNSMIMSWEFDTLFSNFNPNRIMHIS